MEQSDSKNYRFNMGCGYKILEGYINVDLFPECNPDQVVDLEKLPWPWPDNCASEVLFKHSLEHLGATTPLFLGIMKELYRICQDGAQIVIHVPHPRHDHFLDDPTHVRAITPAMLQLFSKAGNDYVKKINASDTPLAHYLNVDFDLQSVVVLFSEKYQSQYEKGEVSFEELFELGKERNNIINEYFMTLKAIKPSLSQPQ